MMKMVLRRPAWQQMNADIPPPLATRDGEDGTSGDWAQQACEVAETEKTANCTGVDQL